MKQLLGSTAPSHITVKLSLFVSVVVIVAFSILEVYNFLRLKSEITQRIHNEQFAQAKYIADDIRNKLEKRIQFIDVLADIIPPETIRDTNKLKTVLTEHFSLTNFFPQGFAVIPTDGQGVLIESPVVAGRKNLSFVKSKWFNDAKQKKQVVLGKPFMGRAYKKIIIIIAKALRDEDGNVLAVLETPIVLDSPGFLDYVFAKDYRPQGDILVISRTNEMFVASSHPKLLLKPTPPPGKNHFHDKVMNGFNGYDQTINAFGQEMLTAAADIKQPDWFVVVRTPVSEVYNAINKRLKTALVNGVLVSILAVFTISLAMFLFFSPLRQAAHAVREMVQKKRALSHISNYKNDEIGDLIIGFNALIDMVNERNAYLEKANARLESLSQTDGLTEVANRRWFDQTFAHSWRVQRRKQQPLTLILIDIDYFKRFNDKYGHIAGDDCLKLVAKTLQKCLKRPTDFFARYGGEEFVILLQGDIKEGLHIAKKSRQAVNDLRITHGDSIYRHITISMGIASMVPQKNSRSVELIEQADKALYQSKERGRNRFQCYGDLVDANYVDFGEYI